MIILDWIAAAILLVFAVLGFRRGLVGEIFRIAAVIVGLFGGFAFYGRLAELLLRFFPLGWQKGIQVVSFIIVFAAFAGLTVLLGMLISKILQLTLLSWVDRIGGAVMGLVKGLLIVGVLVWVITLLPSLEKRVRMDKSIVAKKSTAAISFIRAKAEKKDIWQKLGIMKAPEKGPRR